MPVIKWNEQLAAAYLLRVIEPADVLLYLAVQQYGYIDTASMLFNDTIPSPFDSLLNSKKIRTQEQFIVQMRKDEKLLSDSQYHILTPEDPTWPHWLLHRFITSFDPHTESAQMIKRPIIPPLALWVRSSASDCGFSDNPAIGIVGTRAHSSYGKQLSHICVHELAPYGYTIISGGASGIDAAVHSAALTSGLKTIAVLAGGVDNPTPSSNDTLFSAILDQGMLISEYPPGYTPMKHRFLVRNRIIAGLSNAVVVLEAPLRSGALNTAWWARKIGCPLGAFPGPADRPNNAGCHELIRARRAVLCSTGKHISELFALSP